MNLTPDAILRVRAQAFIKVVFQIADETIVKPMEQRDHIKEKVSQLLAKGLNPDILNQLEKIVLEEEPDQKTINMIEQNKQRYLGLVRKALETNQETFTLDDFTWPDEPTT